VRLTPKLTPPGHCSRRTRPSRRAISLTISTEWSREPSSMTSASRSRKVSQGLIQCGFDALEYILISDI
jgi:hypothetical protein